MCGKAAIRAAPCCDGSSSSRGAGASGTDSWIDDSTTQMTCLSICARWLGPSRPAVSGGMTVAGPCSGTEPRGRRISGCLAAWVASGAAAAAWPDRAAVEHRTLPSGCRHPAPSAHALTEPDLAESPSAAETYPSAYRSARALNAASSHLKFSRSSVGMCALPARSVTRVTRRAKSESIRRASPSSTESA